MNRNEATLVLTGIFVGCLTIAQVLAVKQLQFYWIIFPAGTLLYSITFLCTDTIEEVMGRRTATIVVFAGFITQVVVAVLTYIMVEIPGAGHWTLDREFRTVVGMVPRIVLGSIVAYFVSQFHDVWAFNFWKAKTRGRFLWLRNNLSTIVSQFIDSAVFMAAAFLGILPLDVILLTIIGLWIVKVLIALADTPFCYLLVHILKKMPG